MTVLAAVELRERAGPLGLVIDVRQPMNCLVDPSELSNCQSQFGWAVADPFTQDNRDRRRAGTSLRTSGSNPMLQAFARRTAQRLVARSPARDSRSLTCVNFSVKPVRAAISKRISGRSTRGRRALTSSRKRRRLGGSSNLSRPDKTSSSLPSRSLHGQQDSKGDGRPPHDRCDRAEGLEL